MKMINELSVFIAGCLVFLALFIAWVVVQSQGNDDAKKTYQELHAEQERLWQDEYEHADRSDIVNVIEVDTHNERISVRIYMKPYSAGYDNFRWHGTKPQAATLLKALQRCGEIIAQEDDNGAASFERWYLSGRGDEFEFKHIIGNRIQGSFHRRGPTLSRNEYNDLINKLSWFLTQGT